MVDRESKVSRSEKLSKNAEVVAKRRRLIASTDGVAEREALADFHNGGKGPTGALSKGLPIPML
jgi:hypothetical protein